MTTALDPRHRVFEVFAQAMHREAAARAAFVRTQCAGDTALESEVLALLARQERDTDATQRLLALTASPEEESQVGKELGHFRLVERIGAGGMGVVYRAERTDGVPQTVAIKLIRREIFGNGRKRFIKEARLLARLEHPAIARFIDAGVEDGEGWIALELVRGQSIDDYCDDRGLGVHERTLLLAMVADAVATAQRMQVVHLDLKPSNVLVTPEGWPKLIDFGIAAAIREAGAAPGPEPTQDVQRLFTPHYAAPEQVEGGALSEASDVFGLGALAYRLLSGRLLFEQSRSAVSYAFSVLHEEVEAPSAAARAQGRDAAWVGTLRGDLDSILLKALQRDPARRYANAQAMQDDLQRYLDGHAISARAPSLVQHAGRWSRRLARAWGLGGRRRGPRVPGWFNGARTPPQAGPRKRPAIAVALALLAIPLAVAGLWQLGLRTVDARTAAEAPRAYEDSPEARDLYMKSRFELSTRTPDGLQAAQRGFRRLVDLYPSRAPAWSGLAETYLLSPEFAAMTEGEAYTEAGRAAREAMRLDPSLAEAWAASAFVAFWWERDAPRAFREFERALALDPAAAKTYQWYGNALAFVGAFDQALKFSSKARTIDPNNRAIVADEAWVRFCAGHRAEAVADLEHLAKIEPGFYSWHHYLSQFYLIQGRDADAMREALTAAGLSGQAGSAQQLRAALAQLESGGRSAMLRQLSASEEDAWRRGVTGTMRGTGSPTTVAAYRALAGDRDGMLKWLAVAKQAADPRLTGLRGDPFFEAMRSDPALQPYFLL